MRTFGCQMNEHDSERIAGLLAAQGLEAAADPESADVVVLNTCCVRENADDKLYGHLGHLKSLKARYGSGLDFLSLFQLEGGMPTRVTVPEARLEDALAAINGTPRVGTGR